MQSLKEYIQIFIFFQLETLQHSFWTVYILHVTEIKHKHLGLFSFHLLISETIYMTPIIILSDN